MCLVLTPDSSPVEHLFVTTPLPTLSQGAGPSLVSSSFQKYKSALQRQICGRTVMLDDVLGPLETRAKVLQLDFSQAATGQGEDTRVVATTSSGRRYKPIISRNLADQLKEVYRPDAEGLCSGIIKSLESAAEGYIHN